jgi:hypothetical protein
MFSKPGAQIAPPRGRHRSKDDDLWLRGPESRFRRPRASGCQSIGAVAHGPGPSVAFRQPVSGSAGGALCAATRGGQAAGCEGGPEDPARPALRRVTRLFHIGRPWRRRKGRIPGPGFGCEFRSPHPNFRPPTAILGRPQDASALCRWTPRGAARGPMGARFGVRSLYRFCMERTRKPAENLVKVCTKPTLALDLSR